MTVNNEQLVKQATKVVEALERANDTNQQLLQKTAAQTARITTLEKAATDQALMIDAQAQALFMVKEGEIDAEQVQEVVDKILKYGPDLYKEAVAGGHQTEAISFGKVSDTKLSEVEKTASGPTYNGVEVTNPVEQVLLEFQSQKYGTPGLQR